MRLTLFTLTMIPVGLFCNVPQTLCAAPPDIVVIMADDTQSRLE